MYNSLHDLVQHMVYTQVAQVECDGLTTGLYELCTNEVMSMTAPYIEMSTLVIAVGSILVIAMIVLRMLISTVERVTVFIS